MEDTLAQVQASKNLLDALRALPRFPDISRSECARLQRCLALHALTPAQLACAAQGIKQAGFLQKDEELLLDMVASATCQSAPPPAAGKGSRVGLQDWETVPAFFQAVHWNMMKRGEYADVLDFLVRMGLRNPGEPTVLTIALCMLWSGEDTYQKVLAMPVAAKLEFVKGLKQMLKARTKRAVHPPILITTLQKTPNELQVMHPDIYSAMYMSEPPVPCPIPELEMVQMRSSSRMRSVKCDASMAVSRAMRGPAHHHNLHAQFMQWVSS